MASDSLIRLRQLNKVEVSGFTVDIIRQYLTTGTGVSYLTGQLSGLYYPLNQNPSGYISSFQTGYVLNSQTGDFVDNSILAVHDANLLSQISSLYYSNANPNGYINQLSGDSVYVKYEAAISGKRVRLFDSGRNFYPFDLNPSSWFFIRGTSGSEINFYSPTISGFDITGNNITSNGFPVVTINQTGSFYPFFSNPSNFISSSQTGQFYPNSNPSGFIPSSITGRFVHQNDIRDILLFGNFTVNGAIDTVTNSLINLIGFSTLNWDTRKLIGPWSGSNFSISGSPVLTYYHTGLFYPISGNPSSFISSAQTGDLIDRGQTGQFISTGQSINFITTSQTGAFYAASNPSNYVNANFVAANYAALVNAALIANTSHNYSFYLYDRILSRSNFQFNDSSAVFLLTNQSGTAIIDIYGSSNGGSPTQSGFNISGNNITSNGSPVVTMSMTGNFVVTGFTGAFITTGQTGQFYSSSNPNGYISSGTSGSLVSATTFNAFTGQFLKFLNILPSGIDFSGIVYPLVLATSPRSVACELENNIDSFIYAHVISSVTNSGFMVYFSDILSSSGLILHTTVDL